MKVSVVITNFNGGPFLDNCLRALGGQSYREFRIIVVDNASTDGCVDDLENRFPEITLIRLNDNLGFAGGTNVGIRACSTPYVVLLNNDTIVDPDWLKELVRVADNGADMVASRILRLDDPSIIDRAGDLFTLAGVALLRGHLDEAGDCLAGEEDVFGASACAALYTRDLLEDVGLFDESFFCLHEDVDVCVRARLLGYRCRYAPAAVVLHKGSATIGASSYNAAFWGQRNQEFVFIKNLPLAFIIRYGIHHVLFDICAFLHALLNGNALAFIRAKTAVIAALPTLLSKRRKFIRRVKLGWREFAALCAPDWFSLRWKQYVRQRRFLRR